MRRRAVRNLYKQFRTEKGFSWYHHNPSWREKMRKVYPVEWVSAHHQMPAWGSDFPPSLVNAQARRLFAFDKEIQEIIDRRKYGGRRDGGMSDTA